MLCGGDDVWHRQIWRQEIRQKVKGSLTRATLSINLDHALQRGLDLKPPGLQQRLRDVLRVLVAPRPFAQAGRAQVLIGGELILTHDLLELGDGGDNWADRLGLAPVGISASLSHEKCLSTSGG